LSAGDALLELTAWLSPGMRFDGHAERSPVRYAIVAVAGDLHRSRLRWITEVLPSFHEPLWVHAIAGSRAAPQLKVQMHKMCGVERITADSADRGTSGDVLALPTARCADPSRVLALGPGWVA